MSETYARLKDGWMLRGWSNMPRTLVNWTNGEQRELKDLGFYVAESCDGQTDFESFAGIVMSKSRLFNFETDAEGGLVEHLLHLC